MTGASKFMKFKPNPNLPAVKQNFFAQDNSSMCCGSPVWCRVRGRIVVEDLQLDQAVKVARVSSAENGIRFVAK